MKAKIGRAGSRLDGGELFALAARDNVNVFCFNNCFDLAVDTLSAHDLPPTS
jgi:hypothetical protein